MRFFPRIPYRRWIFPLIALLLLLTCIHIDQLPSRMRDTWTLHEWTPTHLRWEELLATEGITYSGRADSEASYSLSYIPPKEGLRLDSGTTPYTVPYLQGIGVWQIPDGGFPKELTALPHMEDMLYQQRSESYDDGILYEYTLLRPYSEDTVLYIRIRHPFEIQNWEPILAFLRSIQLIERHPVAIPDSTPGTVTKEFLAERLDIPAEDILYCSWITHEDGRTDATVITADLRYTCSVNNAGDVGRTSAFFVNQNRNITPAEVIHTFSRMSELMIPLTQTEIEHPVLYDGLSVYTEARFVGIPSLEAQMYQAERIFTQACAEQYRNLTDPHGRPCFLEREDGGLLITHTQTDGFGTFPAMYLKSDIRPLSEFEWEADVHPWPNAKHVPIRIRKISDTEWRVDLPEPWGTARLIWEKASWKWDISVQLALCEGLEPPVLESPLPEPILWTLREWTPPHVRWEELLATEGITYSGEVTSEYPYEIAYTPPPEDSLVLDPHNFAYELPTVQALGLWHIPRGSFPEDPAALPHVEEMLYQVRTYAEGRMYEYALFRPYAEDRVLYLRLRHHSEIEDFTPILDFLRSVELIERREPCLFSSDYASVYRESDTRIRIETAGGAVFRFAADREGERILAVSDRGPTGLPVTDRLYIGIQSQANTYGAEISLKTGESVLHTVTEESLAEAIGIPRSEIRYCVSSVSAGAVIEAHVTTADTQYTLLRYGEEPWRITADPFVYQKRDITPEEIRAYWESVLRHMGIVGNLAMTAPVLQDGLTLYESSRTAGVASYEALQYTVERIFTEACAKRYLHFTDFYGRPCFLPREDGTLLVTNKQTVPQYGAFPKFTAENSAMERHSDTEWRLTLPGQWGTVRLVWEGNSWKWDLTHIWNLQEET